MEGETSMVTLMGSKSGTKVIFDKRIHVKLSDGVYEKSDSDFIVNISGAYYRKASNLIEKASERFYKNGVYGIKTEMCDCVFSREKIFISDSSTVNGNIMVYEKGKMSVISSGNYHHSIRFLTIFHLVNGVSVNNHIDQYSLDRGISDGFLVRSSRDIVFKSSDVLTLHSSYSTSDRNYYVGDRLSEDQLIKDGVLSKIDGSLHKTQDIFWSKDPNGEKYKPIYNRRTGYRIDERESPFSKTSSIDPSKKESVYTAIRSYSAGSVSKSSATSVVNGFLISQFIGSSELDSDFESGKFSSKMGIILSSKPDADFIDDLCDWIHGSSNTEMIRRNIDKMNWMGSVSREPLPSLYTGLSIGNQGGDFVYSINKKNYIGDSYKSTGEIGYTFGVELETEKGAVPLQLAMELPVDCVGDRSVGGLEYVTGVLSGDSGMHALFGLIDQISRYCYVADTCGVHVHVGGDGNKWNPLFDKEFSVLAIKLGCLIEKELFSLLPENRMSRTNSSGQSYCGSILNYSDISLKNWKTLLFDYVYGRQPESNNEAFSDIKSLVSSNNRLNRWTPGRYKWLNLVNCTTDNSGRRNSSSGFQTIEFRAFNGTLNKEDIRMYILFSLAFVMFIEKNRGIIMDLKSLSINKMIGSVLSQGVSTEFNEWAKNRLDIISQISNKNKTERNIIA